MRKAAVFVTRDIGEKALARLRPVVDLEVWPGDYPPPRSVILEKVPGLFGLLTLLTDPIDAEVINSAGPELKVISQMAVGVDNIDVKAATARGIPVGNTPGVLTETTADMAWALLMAVARRVVEADQQVRQGIWKPWGPDVLTGPDIHGSTIGIIGFGRIGQAVARRARGFNMKILYFDPQRQIDLEESLGVEYAPLNDLLSQSDFISLHTFLNASTRHMISKQQFECMKPSAILINTSRGGVVDPAALTWALQEKKIAGAGLDVYDPEPIQKDNPILGMSNVVITPHIASASIETRRKMALMAVENVLAAVLGKKLPYCVNPEVY